MPVISSKVFMVAAEASVFNKSEWTPVGEPMSLETYLENLERGSYSHVSGAEVTETLFPDGNIGTRISVMFDDNRVIDFALSGKSTLQAGDTVDPATMKGQLLKKYGRNDIVRWDAEKK